MMNINHYVEQKPTTCNICGGKVILIKVGKEHSTSEYIYKCTNCGASVGTHYTNPNLALGTLADLETKKMRRQAHLWFDKLWNTKEERESYYQKLANNLGIERNKCHFGLMNKETLDIVVPLLKKWWFEKFDR